MTVIAASLRPYETVVAARSGHAYRHETGAVGELPWGGCTEYARRGVILVSVGYRLNVFHLFRSQNYGLHDQLAAIRWVREHIAAFGGDPGRITLMGQSAGAMSIMDLCYSDALQGVVRGAILMSGAGLVPAPTGPWTEEQDRDEVAQAVWKVSKDWGVPTR